MVGEPGALGHGHANDSRDTFQSGRSTSGQHPIIQSASTGQWPATGGLTNYTARYPPSTGMAAPVTHEDSSLAR